MHNNYGQCKIFKPDLGYGLSLSGQVEEILDQNYIPATWERLNPSIVLLTTMQLQSCRAKPVHVFG